MARLLLKLIVLVLLISLVSCQITSFASSISYGISSISLESSVQSSDTPSSSSISSSSSNSITINSESDTDSSIDESEYSEEKYPFENYSDDYSIDNGCVFLFEYIIKPNFDLHVLDTLKDIPSTSNCSNVNNSIASYQLFSNAIRNICPTKQTELSKSMFRQIESILINQFGREMYFESKKDNCSILFERSFGVMLKFSHDLMLYNGDTSLSSSSSSIQL